MQPFSITCETCAAKLKVRRATAIGQRLACPKCGTMLKVLPPENWTPPADLDPEIRQLIADARQPTASFDFEDMDAIIAQAESPTTQPTQPSTAPNDSAESSPATPGRMAPEEAVKAVRQRSNLTPPKKKLDTVPVDSPNEPLLPNAQWTSEAEKKKRKILTIAAIALSSLLVLTVGITAVAINWADPQQANNVDKNGDEQTKNSDSEDAAATGTTDNEKSATTNEPGQKDTEQVDDPNNSSGTDNTNPQSTANPENSGDNQSGGTSPEGASPVVPDMPPEIDVDGNPPQVADSGAPSNQEKAPLLPDNPMLPGDKPKIDLGADQTQSPLSAATLLDSIVGQTPELDGFEAIFDASGASFSELEDIADANARIELGTPKYFIEKKEPESTNLQRVLDTKIKNIRYTDISLVYLLNELSRLGVAWDFDAVALASVNFDFAQKISLELEDVTARETFEAIAKQLDMAVSFTAEPYPLVTFTLQLANQPTTKEYPLPFKESDALADFAKMIPQLIAPGSWPENIDDAIQVKSQSVAVTTTPQIQRQIADLSKSMMAVATYNDKPDDPVANDHLIPFPVRVQKTVEQPLSLKPQLRLPLWAFLDQVHERTGVLILVDWSEAIKIGWTPETTVPGNILEPDIESLLQQLCHSLDMSWAAIDEQTVELTSHEQAESRTFVAAYPFKMILNDKITPTDIKTFVFGTVLGKQIQQPNVRIMDQVEFLCFVAVTPQSLHQKIAPVMAKLRGTTK